MNNQTYFKSQSKKIDQALLKYLPKKNEHPEKLHEAMRYGVISGGKRIRPILALAACRIVGGDEAKTMPAACAIELIHSYSLIHDDLPCMDDDDFRRGKPACHKKFSENVALLAGDALLTLAFKVLVNSDTVCKDIRGRNLADKRSSLKGKVSSRLRGDDMYRQLVVVSWIAEAIGSRGMVGGQVLDLENQGTEVDLPDLEFINTKKTGALIAVSLRVGAYLGGGSEREIEALYTFGKHLGFLFQIVDDILDQEGYAKVLGDTQAKKEALSIAQRSKMSLTPFGKRALFLREIVDFILARKN